MALGCLTKDRASRRRPVLRRQKIPLRRKAARRIPTSQRAGGQAPQKERSKSDPSAGATVMNRVRGGVRMFIGKVSGNREKVEEGERLKRGAQ